MEKTKTLIIPAAFALLIILIIFVWAVFINEPAVGHGPQKQIHLTLAWNNEKIQIPAPVTFPEWGKHSRQFRLWKRKKDARDFTTHDLEGCTYIANGLGFIADPQNPDGKFIPDIHAVSRIGPDGKKQSWTGYNIHGPSEWCTYDQNGQKAVEVLKTSIGLTVNFFDAQGNNNKEWTVNKKGNIYWESVKQNGKWIVTHDLEKLKTSEDVPWAEDLRKLMEYYPGR